MFVWCVSVCECETGISEWVCVCVCVLFLMTSLNGKLYFI